mmetsp:Transcript_21192/g.53693  ORF Transcript_21192/g.53693 Transcript_21192/m.53693 type:complete len:407 (+) Transcript_21192:82-1302(+)|eukprot:CAMPEP_0179873380 /NCGR_PEP_ID=MMETSP0982-20121206/22141_1 /TAXON_ID=483367 /ORGANISM="non described non described, Strain CCMP 2436" /LENGTH=406 /DNA_ID=CAMNT_0021764739 /DNA_START=69 /DNA_END=1289 /DNA_ORIENTATION=-
MGNAQGKEIALSLSKEGLVMNLAEDIPEDDDEEPYAGTPVKANDSASNGKTIGDLGNAVKADYLDKSPVRGRSEVDLPFRLERTLGAGAFGVVRLGTHIETNDKLAVKIIPKAKLIGPGAVGMMEREIRMMKLLRHEHIVRLYEVVIARTKVYLGMEYADGGDMLAFVNSRKLLTEPEAAELFSQIVDGVVFCHKLGVCHRDLKLENILLSKGKIKIADFGLANYSPPPTTAGEDFMQTHCGSPLYAAPELLRNTAAYDATKVDIWSLGVVLYALVCRRLPFAGDNLPAILKKIVSADYNIPDTLSGNLEDLLKRMLAIDPAERLSAEEVESHPWLKEHTKIESVGIERSNSLDELTTELADEVAALSTGGGSSGTSMPGDAKRRPATMDVAALKRELAAEAAEQK